MTKTNLWRTGFILPYSSLSQFTMEEARAGMQARKLEAGTEAGTTKDRCLMALLFSVCSPCFSFEG